MFLKGFSNRAQQIFMSLAVELDRPDFADHKKIERTKVMKGR